MKHWYSQEVVELLDLDRVTIVNLIAYYKHKYHLSTLDVNPIKFEDDTYLSITFHYPIDEEDPNKTQGQRNLLILEFTQKLLRGLGMSNISSNEVTSEIVQITFKVEQPKI